jgi:SAM-dependent methyltransferase
MKGESSYRPAWVTARYDEYAEREWERFDLTPATAVSLHVHSHYLREFVTPGSRVLDVGAGPGRFTRVLAEMGCRVVVADISPVQLELHRKHAAELGFEDAVEDRLRLDVCDMSRLSDASFDAVVCYGGPLSYVFEKAATALRECVRVSKPGGRVLASVMSLWGSAHGFLPGVLAVPPEINRRITDTGDLTPTIWPEANHHCHMFRSGELRRLFRDAGLDVLGISASNCVSSAWDEVLTEARADPDTWQEVLRMELEACKEEGCLDMGAHMIIVGGKS